MIIIVEVATKTSIILSLTVILVAIAGRSSAAARYFIWLTGLCGALALPLVLYLVPSLSIPIPVAAKPTTISLENSRVETVQSSEIDLPAQELPTPSVLSQTPPPSSASTAAALPVPWPTSMWLIIWLIGALLVATRSMWSIYDVLKLRRGSRPVTDSRLLDLFSGLRRELSISANISLRVGSESVAPMTWGVIRHTILLPQEAIGWTAERVRLVLTHELAHVTRKDVALQFVIYGACSLYWFNPLVWYAAKRMWIERECACDDQVLNIGVDIEDYATHLVEIARSAVLSRTLAVSITHPSHFEQRIRTLLDMRTNRSVFSRWGKSIMAGAAAIFVLITASAHLTALPSSALFLVTSAPSLPPPETRLSVSTAQAAPARNVPPQEDTTEISVGVSGQVTERIPSPWDYPRPDMFPGTIGRSSKGVVFIPFAIYRDGYDTRVRVKHLPVGTDSGMVRVGLYSQADSLHVAAPNVVIKTAGKKVGSGLKTDGTLAAGSTWTTTVSELLRAAAGPADFYGYIFIDTPFRDVEVDVHIIKPDGTEMWTPAEIFPHSVPSKPLQQQATQSPSPAQQAANLQTHLSFEVASIKPSIGEGSPYAGGYCRGTDTTGTGNRMAAPTPLGRCIFNKIYISDLIQRAFGDQASAAFSPNERVTGGPEWIRSERYDLEAKAEDPATNHSGKELRLMLQNLLTDRLKLKFHVVSKEIAGYALVVANGGPKFKEADEKELPRSFGSPPPTPGQFVLNGQSMTMANLSETLSMFGTYGAIIDNTGLNGRYDFKLTWALEPGATVKGAAVTKTDDTGPSVFTALQEQLGLRLQAQKVSVAFLVIDSVEKPTQQ